MLNWIKTHKLIVVVAILILLAITGFLIYWFWYKPTYIDGVNEQHRVIQQSVPVEAPPPQIQQNLPVATSAVSQQRIRKIPRPRPSMASSDVDTRKSDLRNPGTLADMAASRDDGATHDVGMESSAQVGAGGLDDLFAGDNLPANTEYPTVITN